MLINVTNKCIICSSTTTQNYKEVVKMLRLLKRKLGRFYQRCRRRHGTRPGFFDISSMIRGEPFYATPNFYYFEGCGRPCYLPLNPAPKRGGKDWAVTDGWPLELDPKRFARYPGGYISAFHKLDYADRVLVIGEVTGENAVDEIGQESDLWYVIACPPNKVVRNAHLIQERDEKGNCIVYANSLWLGNTGSHGLPLYPMPQATIELLNS